MKRIIREYKQGRQKNFFLREHEGTYFLEKITKASAYTVKCAEENEMMKYIEDNNFKFVGLIATNAAFSF